MLSYLGCLKTVHVPIQIINYEAKLRILINTLLTNRLKQIIDSVYMFIIICWIISISIITYNTVYQQSPSYMAEQPTIILDANAFITGSDLLGLGATHRLVTTAAVMEELRDVKTREMLEKFAFKIQQLEPAEKSITAIKQFAKKTGDIASLSDVDIGLLALAHTLYTEKGLGDTLRKVPPPMKEWQPQQKDESSQYSDQQAEEEEHQKQEHNEEATQQESKQLEPIKQQQGEQIKEKSTEQPTQKQSQNANINENDDDQGWIVVSKPKKPKKQESDDDMDDEEGWVTPQNYSRKMAEGTTAFDNLQEQQQTPEKQESQISLMTADFAMQNVAIQMGIQLKSLDGRKIKQIRRWIMECYLCFKQYKIESNEIKLCKQCGYNSLSKIAYSLSPNGDIILHRKKGWKPNQKVLEWKQRKFEEQQKKKKHQHARRKKQASIFES